MSGEGETDLAQEVLGSAHAFSAAVGRVVERRLLREVAGARLSFAQLTVLRLVALTDSPGVGDVATFLGVTKAAASKAVDKLVRRRLLRRSEGAEDRRETQLSLTESGRRILAAYEEAKGVALFHLLEGIEPERLRATATTLDFLAAALADGAASGEACLLCGSYFREGCRLLQLTGGECFYLRHRVPKELR